MTTTRVVTVQLFKGISITGMNQSGIVGAAFSASYASLGGIAPLAYAVSGTLPPSVSSSVSGSGVTLTSSSLGGSDAGAWTFSISARDANRLRVQKTFSISIIALPLQISNSFSDYTAGVAQSFTYTTSGGIGAKTFAVTSGSLPSGLSLASDGTLSGNTTGLSVGTHSYTFGVTAIDSTMSASPELSQTITVTVVAISITNSATTPTQGTSYTFTYTKSGGTGAVTWSKQSGTLPTGLTLSSSGVLSGTPSSAGNYAYVVAVTDNAGTVATHSESVTVIAPFVLTGTFATPLYDGVSYSQSITISGGTSPYSAPAVASGSLPQGLSLSVSGSNLVLSGTCTQGVTSTFTVTVNDSLGATSGASSSQSLTRQDQNFSHVSSLIHGNGTNGGTTITDQAGLTWTNTNVTTSTTQSKFNGSSMRFSGSALLAIATTPASLQFGTGAYTIEAFVRADTISATQNVFSQRASTIFPSLRLAVSKLNFFDTATSLNGTATLSSTTWYHVAISYDGTTHRTYVNGTQDGTTGIGNLNCNGTTGTTLGRRNDSASEFLTGYLAEVRITKGIARYVGTSFTPPADAFPNS